MVLHHTIKSKNKLQALTISAIGASLLLMLLGLYIDTPWLGVVFPIIVTGLFLMLYYPTFIYFGLFSVIPLTSELELSGGLSTDIPGEPLLWATTLMTLLFVLTNKIPSKLFYPIGFIIFAQVLWLIVTSLFAEDLTLSLKYSAAKLWYILPFFVLPFYLIKNRKDLHKLFDLYLIGLLIASLYFFVSHAQVGFDFLAKTEIGKPIWRNHVNYACCLVISLPIAIYRRQTVKAYKLWRYTFLIIAIMIFMYFSYARVVYLCLAAGIGYYFILYLRLTKPTIIVSLIIISWLGFCQLKHANYIRFAPDYSSTIMQESFDKKIAATLEGKDISTMERLHRWVAGLRMVEQNPLLGVGPSNFYSSYKKYTVHSFETYVSDNPERSGIHNYYLMIAVEQGIPGLLLLLGLIITALIYIEKVFHSSNNMQLRRLALLSGTCMIMIISLNSINDMLEVIKIGGLFYFMLFIASSASNPLFLRVEKEE